MIRRLSTCVLLVFLGPACNSGGTAPPVAPKTDFSTPPWLKDPGVPGIAADFNGTWERENSPNKSRVIIEGDALQQLGKDRMDPNSLRAFFGLRVNFDLYVNNFAGDIGVFAFEFDDSAGGGERRQYGIKAVVARDQKLYLQIVVISKPTPTSAVEMSEFLWICRRS